MDLAVVDSLARFALAERRRGRVFRLRDAPAELRELLVLTGLDGVLLAVQPGREPDRKSVV